MHTYLIENNEAYFTYSIFFLSSKQLKILLSSICVLFLAILFSIFITYLKLEQAERVNIALLPT